MVQAVAKRKNRMPADPDGDQQQELLAPIAVEGDAGGDDERMVEGAGFGECQ
jgi:hypothetical protein